MGKRGGRTGATAPRWEGRAAGGRARALFEGTQPGPLNKDLARMPRVAELGYVVAASKTNSLLDRYCDVQDRVGDGR